MLDTKRGVSHSEKIHPAHESPAQTKCRICFFSIKSKPTNIHKHFTTPIGILELFHCCCLTNHPGGWILLEICGTLVICAVGFIHFLYYWVRCCLLRWLGKKGPKYILPLCSLMVIYHRNPLKKADETNKIQVLKGFWLTIEKACGWFGHDS